MNQLGVFGAALQLGLEFSRPKSSGKAGVLNTQELFGLTTTSLKAILAELLDEGKSLSPSTNTLGIELSSVSSGVLSTNKSALDTLKLKARVLDQIISYKDSIKSQQDQKAEARKKLQSLLEQKSKREEEKLGSMDLQAIDQMIANLQSVLVED